MNLDKSYILDDTVNRGNVSHKYSEEIGTQLNSNHNILAILPKSNSERNYKAQDVLSHYRQQNLEW